MTSIATTTTAFPPRAQRGQRLYFAYGSNLWMEQMARRCPSSYLVGRAVLPDYQWQINERGYANVVPRAGYAVHGLVYELDGDAGAGGTDEARLDRSEGVHTGAYSKEWRDVVLYEAAPALRLPTRAFADAGGATPMLREMLGEMLGETGGGAAASSLFTEQRPTRIERDVLVYLSSTYTMPSEPRNEYIDRMNRGIADAIAIGVPGDFFETVVRRFIPDRPPPALSPPQPYYYRPGRSRAQQQRR
ncbi:hypothetical protein MYCTH_2304336 [Thermothelomyces thermophilus ATCC 42464]|uniref:gamma-glutamylcyclotransferase n=1 Tax=Thermothelomyces thermophilus (strain ATCC 42464 / BCRC 31852 / DSM 1799) TaxID=573729 RepID=G2QEI3_THET4|nr:uncharacterized protein MYCTH_2304336 [Thermothelomyces thermophilus ATCC 42464]AEO57766.1 hypothetical protein MYCTH_2304336 [Thermothelomyces thermophilus ATCC 42464]